MRLGPCKYPCVCVCVCVCACEPRQEQLAGAGKAERKKVPALPRFLSLPRRPHAVAGKCGASLPCALGRALTHMVARRQQRASRQCAVGSRGKCGPCISDVVRDSAQHRRDSGPLRAHEASRATTTRSETSQSPAVSTGHVPAQTLAIAAALFEPWHWPRKTNRRAAAPFDASSPATRTTCCSARSPAPPRHPLLYADRHRPCPPAQVNPHHHINQSRASACTPKGNGHATARKRHTRPRAHPSVPFRNGSLAPPREERQSVQRRIGRPRRASDVTLATAAAADAATVPGLGGLVSSSCSSRGLPPGCPLDSGATPAALAALAALAAERTSAADSRWLTLPLRLFGGVFGECRPWPPGGSSMCGGMLMRMMHALTKGGRGDVSRRA